MDNTEHVLQHAALVISFEMNHGALLLDVKACESTLMYHALSPENAVFPIWKLIIG